MDKNMDDGIVDSDQSIGFSITVDLGILFVGTTSDLKDPLVMHMDCGQNTSVPWAFHAVCYSIEHYDFGFDKWPHGRLYDGEGEILSKKAFTVHSHPFCRRNLWLIWFQVFAYPAGTPESSRYWTIIVLAPASFRDPNSELDDYKEKYDLSSMTLWEAKLHFISIAMNYIQAQWTIIVKSFENLLRKEENTIFSRKEHDHLFFDDAVFSRSRKYFWAIDTLTQIDSLITDNIHQWTQYKSDHFSSRADKLEGLTELEWYRAAEGCCSELEQKRDAIRRYLSSFQLLRDGVFVH